MKTKPTELQRAIYQQMIDQPDRVWRLHEIRPGNSPGARRNALVRMVTCGAAVQVGFGRYTPVNVVELRRPTAKPETRFETPKDGQVVRVRTNHRTVAAVYRIDRGFEVEGAAMEGERMTAWEPIAASVA